MATPGLEACGRSIGRGAHRLSSGHRPGELGRDLSYIRCPRRAQKLGPQPPRSHQQREDRVWGVFQLGLWLNQTRGCLGPGVTWWALSMGVRGRTAGTWGTGRPRKTSLHPQ